MLGCRFLWMAGLALLLSGVAARPADAAAPVCQTFNLAEKGDTAGLAAKLLGVAAGGLLLVGEAAEPKAVQIAGAALGAVAASIDLVGVVKGYFGAARKVDLCTTTPDQRPVLGIDSDLVRSTAARQIAGPPPAAAFDPLAPPFERVQRMDRLFAHNSLMEMASRPLLVSPGRESPNLAQAIFAASLGGRVVDFVTGRPIAGAAIRLVGEFDTVGVSQETLSSADGTFNFRGLAPGKYQLAARDVGYFLQSANVDVAAGPAATRYDVALMSPIHP